MSKIPEISIIIPVYNVELYLSSCLNSIVNQTFSAWECILVDDGSSDNSGSICDEYALKDSRFRVIHKRNEGASSARNNGLVIASGNWISFVDSDDYIEKNTYEKALYVAKKNNAYQIQWGIAVEKNNAILREEKYKDGFFDIWKTPEYAVPSMCHKLIAREIIFENNITFPTDVKLSEDRYFSLMCYLYCSNTYFISDVFYHYRIYSNSSSHSMKESQLNDEIKIIKRVEEVILNKGYQSICKNVINIHKTEIKNHSLFLFPTVNCTLWRKTFPELNLRLLLSKNKKIFVYWLLNLHLDIFVRLLISTKKRINHAC